MAADAGDVQQLENIVCTRCGCVCDDIRLAKHDEVVVRVDQACNRGVEAFLNGAADLHQTALIDGVPTTLEVAAARAAEILLAARRPLIVGLESATTEAQRIAVEIGDRVGGAVDVSIDHTGVASLALQNVGQVACTMGEIRNRADVFVFWGCDPVSTHPRLFERLVQPPLKFGDESASRRILVVDERRTQTAESATTFLQLPRKDHFEVVWTLRGLLKGIPFDDDPGFSQVDATASLRGLLNEMKVARYGAFFFDPANCDRMFAEAVYLLVRELNDVASFAAMPLGGPGNPVGAENVLTWQAGYPFAVDFSRGFPRFGPGEHSAREVLESGESDAALLICDETEVPDEVQRRLDSISTIVVGLPASPPPRTTVLIPASSLSRGQNGTVYRMDDVPLPLRKSVESPNPSTETVLRAISAAVLARRDGGST